MKIIFVTYANKFKLYSLCNTTSNSWMSCCRRPPPSLSPRPDKFLSSTLVLRERESRYQQRERESRYVHASSPCPYKMRVQHTHTHTHTHTLSLSLSLSLYFAFSLTHTYYTQSARRSACAPGGRRPSGRKHFDGAATQLLRESSYLSNSTFATFALVPTLMSIGVKLLGFMPGLHFFKIVCANWFWYVWQECFFNVTWPIHTCYMTVTHLYAWHDSSICLTWILHACDMTRLCAQKTTRRPHKHGSEAHATNPQSFSAFLSRPLWKFAHAYSGTLGRGVHGMSLRAVEPLWADCCENLHMHTLGLQQGGFMLLLWILKTSPFPY